MKYSDATERREFLKTGLFAGGTALWSGTFFQTLASADEKKSPAEANTIGRRELLKGLENELRLCCTLAQAPSRGAPRIRPTAVRRVAPEDLAPEVLAPADLAPEDSGFGSSLEFSGPIASLL